MSEVLAQLEKKGGGGGNVNEGEQTLIINAMTPSHNGNHSFSYSQTHTFDRAVAVTVYAAYSRVNSPIPSWTIGPYTGNLPTAGSITKTYVLKPGTYTIQMSHGTGPSGYFVKGALSAIYID